MTITITKWKLAIAVIAIALIAPATALATHVFDDVDDARFYAGPVEWAADNGITTGKTPTQFDPEGNVTRGESVTFLNRYHEAFGPVAYATVLADGSVLAARSSNVSSANVVQENAGGYCFYDLPFDFTTVQVTPLYVGVQDVVTAEIGYAETTGFGLADCDAQSNPELEVAMLESGAWSTAPFAIMFFA